METLLPKNKRKILQSKTDYQSKKTEESLI